MSERVDPGRAGHLVTAVDSAGLHHQLVAYTPHLLPSTIRACLLSTCGGPATDEQVGLIEVVVGALVWRSKYQTTAEQYNEALGVVVTVALLDTFPGRVPHGDDDALLAIVMRRLLTDDQSVIDVITPRGGPRSIAFDYARTMLTLGEREAVTRAIARGPVGDQDDDEGN